MPEHEWGNVSLGLRSAGGITEVHRDMGPREKHSQAGMGLAGQSLKDTCAPPDTSYLAAQLQLLLNVHCIPATAYAPSVYASILSEKARSKGAPTRPWRLDEIESCKRPQLWKQM